MHKLTHHLTSTQQQKKNFETRVHEEHEQRGRKNIRRHEQRHLKGPLFMMALILIIGLYLAIMYHPSLTGLFVYEKGEAHTLDINLTINQSTEIALDHYNLTNITSIAISGEHQKGKVTVLLKSGNVTYKIYEYKNKKGNAITGFVVYEGDADNRTQNLTTQNLTAEITINLSDTNNSRNDSDNTTITVTVNQSDNRSSTNTIVVSNQSTNTTPITNNSNNNTKLTNNSINLTDNTNNSNNNTKLTNISIKFSTVSVATLNNSDNLTAKNRKDKENKTKEDKEKTEDKEEKENKTKEDKEKIISFNDKCLETCILPPLENATLIITTKKEFTLTTISYTTSVQEEEGQVIGQQIKNVSDITIPFGYNHTINGSEYFFNPNNTLLFDITSHKELLTTIKDNLIIIQPTTNGTWKVQLYAVGDELTKSNPFTISTQTPVNNTQDVIIQQSKVTLNNPVKWESKVQTSTAPLDVVIPFGAENVMITHTKNTTKTTIPLSEIENSLPEILTSETITSTNLTNNLTLTFPDASLYQISYTTPAPRSVERTKSIGNKEIVITSPYHYTNVYVETDLPISVRSEGIKLVWKQKSGTTTVENITYFDDNKDGLIERIGWLVPHLSNQTYELSLTILTLQSYPTVNGDWTVLFNTTGTANLTISGYNGTTYREKSINNDTTKDDLSPFLLLCGTTTVYDERVGNYSENMYYVLANGSNIVPTKSINQSLSITGLLFTNYSCDNSTSSWKSRVITSGKHTQQFIFGNMTEYAHNSASYWWNASFPKCKNITITNVGTTTLSNFPAYINLTYDSDMQADYDDIRFVNTSCDNSGSLLSYEVENWTSTSADVWVKIPSLPTTNAIISVYYGNSTASSAEDPTNTWDNDYVLVQHLEEDPGPGGSGDIKDSTKYGNNGTADTSMTAGDQIRGITGGSIDFDGSNDYVTIPDQTYLRPGAGPYTAEVWFKAPNSNQLGQFLSKRDTSSPYPQLSMGIGGDYGFTSSGQSLANYYLTDQSSNYEIFFPANDVADSTWHYSAMTITSNDAFQYLDLVEINNYAQAGTPNPTSTDPVRIGDGQGSFFFSGTVDEVRISNVTRSVDWLNQTYQLMANQGSYVSFGTKTQMPVTTLIVTGTTTLCGNVTGYDKIVVESGGILTVCAFNGTIGTGYANIDLGSRGNFTVLSGGIVNVTGKGGQGGVGAPDSSGTPGNQGDNGQNGSVGIQSNLANGGGGGAANRSSSYYSAAGASGAFGGLPGNSGHHSSWVTVGAIGTTYGASNSFDVLFGSGGGGGAGDGVYAGSAGGGGFKVNVSGGYINVQGQILADGVQGGGGPATDCGAGGSGSGGHIVLVGAYVDISNGVLSAAGAIGGDCTTSTDSCDSGGSGGGRIAIMYNTFLNTSLITNISGGPAGSSVDCSSSTAGAAGSYYIEKAYMNTLWVTLDSPANASQDADGSVIFQCTGVDEKNLDNITLYGDFSGAWGPNETIDLSATTETSYQHNVTLTLSPNTYTWGCFAWDNESHSIWSESNYTVTVPNLAVNTVECQENGTIWHGCGNLSWSDQITAVRANCTTSNGTITNTSFLLYNVEDGTTFFNSNSTYNVTDYWVFNNTDIPINDSGTFDLNATCYSATGQDNGKQTEWSVPWGTLNVTLMTPAVNTNVTKNEFFTFTVNVTCSGGECGHANVTLDPEMVNELLGDENPTPHLTILNPQSYPSLHGTWTVEFNTSGEENLTMTASDGTSFGEYPVDDPATLNDLLVKELLCGNLPVQYTVSGNTVTSSAYSCEQTGYFSVEPITPGKHTIAFGFGNETEIAHNNVLNELINASDNTYVYSANPNKNYGTSSKLYADQSPFLHSFIKFNVSTSGSEITSAILALYVNNVGDLTNILNFSNTTWSELKVTYNNQPVIDGVVIDSLTPSSLGWVYYNLSSVITKNGVYSFFLNDTDTNGVTFNSSRNAIGYPFLNVTYPSDSAPMVTLSKPSSGSSDYDGNVTFQCNISEDFDIDNVTLYGNFSGTWKANATDTLAGTADTSYSQNTTLSLPEGTYIWNCLSADNASQTRWGSANYTLTVNLAPQPKGMISMITGATPFYTTSQNPMASANTSCLSSMKAGNSCSTSWSVNTTGTPGTTYTFFAEALSTQYSSNVLGINSSTVNLTIVSPTPGTTPPNITVNTVECQENGTIWHGCGNLSWSDQITAVRANCTTTNGTITNTSFLLYNVEDGTTFFNSNSTYNVTDYWVFNNTDIPINDSGTFDLNATCYSATGENVGNQTEWSVPWGTLNVTLVTPAVNTNVTKNEFFTFTVNVTCSGGECGHVNATLDPHTIQRLIEENGIDVLNPQSYPMVGGNWTVNFKTDAQGNMAISGINGTTYGEKAPDDLTPLSLTCDNESIEFVWNGSESVNVPNYRCDDIASWTVGVNTIGEHHQMFEIENHTAYANNVASAIFTKRISNSNDDSEEAKSGGSLDTSSSDLEIHTEPVGTGVGYVGMRFTGVTIPQGATINSAKIQFHVDEIHAESSQAMTIRFYGEDIDDAGAFANDGATNNISNRFSWLTTASVNWSVPTWVSVHDEGAAQLSDDLKTIVQEIVNRPGWTSGNSLVIIIKDKISGTGERTAESYDGESASGPLITINYTNASVSTPNTLITPTESTTAEYVIVGSLNGTMTNGYNSSNDQYINLTHATWGRRLEFYGLFSTLDVNISDTIIQASATKTSINVSGATGVGTNHTMYIPNTLNSGVFICPSSNNLLGIVGTCANKVVFSYAEASAGTWKDEIKIELADNQYKISNITGSGGGELPLVSLITPDSSMDYDGNVTFQCNATDDEDLVNVTLYGNFSGTWGINTTDFMSGSTDTFYQQNTSLVLTEGDYLWNCRGYDNGTQDAYASANFTLLVRTTAQSKGTVSMVTGTTPFYTTNQNPMAPANTSCLSSMKAGNSCSTSWSVNATGTLGAIYTFFVEALSTQYSSNILGINSSTVNLTITSSATNTAPDTPSPYIESSSKTNLSSEDLYCKTNITDPEGDVMNTTIKWYKEGTIAFTQNLNNNYASGSQVNATLQAGNTSVGENWLCGVQTYDGALYSGWANSTNLHISNAESFSTCTDLTAAHSTYSLTTDITSTSTCINILANNITLNCDGNTINYSTATSGYGVNITGYNNSIVKNCIIQQIETTISSADGIYLSGSSNNTIINNSINTTGDTSSNAYSSAISLNAVSDDNLIANNTLMINGSYGTPLIYLSVSNHNTILHNNLTEHKRSFPTTGIIRLVNADNNNISYNLLNMTCAVSYGSNAVNIGSGSDNNIFIYNTINANNSASCAKSAINLIKIASATNTTIQHSTFLTLHTLGFDLSGTTIDHFNHTIDETNTINSMPVNYTFNLQNKTYQDEQWINKYGQYICAWCSNVTYSNITTTTGIHLYKDVNILINKSNITSGPSHGIYSYYGTNTSVRGNFISSLSADYYDYGVYFYGATTSNITDSIITAAGVYNSGIYLQSSSRTITDNNSINATNYGSAINLGGSDDNIINHTTIYTNAAISTGNGIFFTTGSVNNTVDNTNITTLGTSGYPLYLGTSVNNNQILNSFLNATNKIDISSSASSNSASWFNLTNVTYNHTSPLFTGPFTIYTYHYADVNVTNSLGTMIADASISATDINGTEIDTATSDGSTLQKMTLYAYYANQTTFTSYNNYTITATHVNYTQGSTSINMTGYRVVQVTLTSTDIQVNLTNPLTSWVTNKDPKLECSYVATINGSNTTLWLNVSSWAANQTLSTPQEKASSLFNVSTLVAGDYIWNCQVCNIDGYCKSAAANRTIMVDLTDPTTTYIDPTPYNNKRFLSTTTNVTINVSSSDTGGVGNHSVFLDWNRSLRGWWSFDSISGSTVYDNSSWKNNATMNNSPRIVEGKYGKGMKFDGINDYVEVVPDPSHNILDELTIDLWFKPAMTLDSNLDNYMVLIDRQWAVTDSYFLAVNADGKLHLGTQGGNLQTTQNSWNANQWYHVIGTYKDNGGTYTGELYVDGELAGLSVDTVENMAGGSQFIGIGGSSEFYKFNGTMDEVKIYSRVLNASEINASFNANTNQYQGTFSNLTEGQSYSYTAYAVDEASNVNSTSRTFTINNRPTISNVVVNTTLGLDSSAENISLWFDGTDGDGDTTTNITDWQNENVSFAKVILPFDTNTSSDAVGAIRDYSQNMYNVTLGNGTTTTNRPTWTSDGIVGGAYQFDGVNDVMSFTQPINFSGSFSLEVWAKGTSDTLNLVGLIAAGPVKPYGLGIDDGDRSLFRVVNSGSNYDAMATGLTTDSNQWYHYVGVFKAGEYVRLYRNGVQIANTAIAAGITQHDPSDYPVWIGHRAYSSWPYNEDLLYLFNGTIDEVKMYDRALTLEYIKASYEAGLQNLSLHTMVSAETSPGDNWSVRVTPNDGYEDGVTINSNTVNIGNPPVINTTATTLSPEGFGRNVTIFANVTDVNNDISNVIVGITRPGSSQINYSMINTTNNEFNFTYQDWTNGTYTYKVYANDTTGSSATSVGGTFELQANITIQVKTIKDVYSANEIVNLTDLSGQDNYQTKIENNGTTNTSTYILLTVKKRSGGNWNHLTTVYNSTIPKTINNTYSLGNIIKLDALFNGQWNTTANGTGDGFYRIYAAAQTNASTVMTGLNGTPINTTYQFIIDSVKPEITLNSPANTSTISTTEANLNWTARDTYDSSINCNITLDGVINVSNINSTNNTPTNRTISGLADGEHFWNITCIDDAQNTNTSLTYNFTIVSNSAPNSPTPIIETPTRMNYTTEDLYCRTNITDPEGDVMNTTVKWYKDGILNQSISLNNNYVNGTQVNTTLQSANTTLGDQWLCSAQSYDGELYSSWVNSTQLTILNSPPTAPILNFPIDGDDLYTNRTPPYNWTNATDPDNDVLTYHLEASLASDFTSTIINVSNITSNTYAQATELDFAQYFWRVRAYDGSNYGSWSNTSNFTLVKSVIITLVNGTTDFGNLFPNDIDDTTDNSPFPLYLRNDGNFEADLVNASSNQSLFSTVSLNTSYWQFKVDNATGEPGAFNQTHSLVNWVNISSANHSLIRNFNYSDASDELEIDIRVQVPGLEPPGQKQGVITLSWEESPT